MTEIVDESDPLTRKRLVLTRDLSGKDVPIWMERVPSNFTPSDGLYFLGANLLIWFKDSVTKKYHPGIIDPSNFKENMTFYKNLVTVEPHKVIFIAGKKMDLLIHPFDSNDESELLTKTACHFKIHFLENGSISKTERIVLEGFPTTQEFSREKIRLYQDKFILLINDETLHVINIFTGSLSKKIPNVPRRGVLILEGSLLHIWSTDQDKRAIVDLERNTVSNMAFHRESEDLSIKGFSQECLLLANSNQVRLYNSYGAIALDRKTDGNIMQTFDGVVESYSSTGMAFVLRKLGDGTLYVFQDGSLRIFQIGKIATRAMLLYEGVVYAATDYSSLDMWSVSELLPSFIKKTIADRPINRFMKISPSFGFVMELTEDLFSKAGEKLISVRSAGSRPLELSFSTKKKWGVIDPEACIIPPFLFQNYEGSTRTWTGEEYITPIGKKAIRLTLYEWDKIDEKMGRKMQEINHLELPEKEKDKDFFIARWFKTDYWITMVMGRRAYVFEHEGSRIDQIIDLDTTYDFHIKEVRGFKRSLWFLSGQTQKMGQTGSGKNMTAILVKQLFFWDGKVGNVEKVEMDTGIVFGGACATGVTSRADTSCLSRAELVISSKDQRDVWLSASFMDDGKGICYQHEFCGMGGVLKPFPSKLCEKADKEGRVFFSQSMIVNVYSPWTQKACLKADLDCLHINQLNPSAIAVVNDDYIRCIEMSNEYLWVTAGNSFYRFYLNSINDTDVTEYAMPFMPICFYGEKTLEKEAQAATLVRPCLSNYQDLADHAIFENRDYIWLSNNPMYLYKKPTFLSNRNINYGIVTGKGKMMVISTHISDAKDQEKRTVSSFLCEISL